MADDKKQPIVIKKIVKGGGHHGGAWKVAYADFVTAMMAFFLLLWLLGMSDESMRGGISDMFKAPSALIGPGGSSTSLIKLGGKKEVPRGKGDNFNEQTESVNQDRRVAAEAESSKVKQIEKGLDKGEGGSKRDDAVREQVLLDQLLTKLKDKIEKSETLSQFKDQLLLEIMPEGLRIQIIDKENRPMFSSGSEKLKSYTNIILREVAKVIASHAPNKISITGHTDVSRFGSGIIEYETVDGEVLRKQYSNWELSADRANAARRALLKGGMPDNQIGRVVGLGSTVLFDKKNTRNPINRRISIIVMKKETVESISFNEGNNNAPQAGIQFGVEKNSH